MVQITRTRPWTLAMPVLFLGSGAAVVLSVVTQTVWPMSKAFKPRDPSVNTRPTTANALAGPTANPLTTQTPADTATDGSDKPRPGGCSPTPGSPP